jgi:hypothetical protein
VPQVNNNTTTVSGPNSKSSQQLQASQPRRLNQQQQQYTNDNVVTTRNISIPLPLPKNHDEHQSKVVSNASSSFKVTNTTNNENSNIKLCDMEDLIHLNGPLTEDAVMKTLQARFNERKFFVNMFKTFFFYILSLMKQFSDKCRTDSVVCQSISRCGKSTDFIIHAIDFDGTAACANRARSSASSEC